MTHTLTDVFCLTPQVGDFIPTWEWNQEMKVAYKAETISGWCTHAQAVELKQFLLYNVFVMKPSEPLPGNIQLQIQSYTDATSGKGRMGGLLVAAGARMGGEGAGGAGGGGQAAGAAAAGGARA